MRDGTHLHYWRAGGNVSFLISNLLAKRTDEGFSITSRTITLMADGKRYHWKFSPTHTGSTKLDCAAISNPRTAGDSIIGSATGAGAIEFQLRPSSPTQNFVRKESNTLTFEGFNSVSFMPIRENNIDEILVPGKIDAIRISSDNAKLSLGLASKSLTATEEMQIHGGTFEIKTFENGLSISGIGKVHINDRRANQTRWEKLTDAEKGVWISAMSGVFMGLLWSIASLIRRDDPIS